MVNALGNDMDGTHASYGAGNLVAQDQPHHAVLRNVVRPSFAAREILALEEHIRGLARQLLTGLHERGGGDFAQEVALPLVFGTSLRFMGAPPEESRFWQEHLMRSMDRTVGRFGVPEDAARSNAEGEEHRRGTTRNHPPALGRPAPTVGQPVRGRSLRDAVERRWGGDGSQRPTTPPSSGRKRKSSRGSCPGSTDRPRPRRRTSERRCAYRPAARPADRRRRRHGPGDGHVAE